MSLQNASQQDITAWVEGFHRASDSLTTTNLGKFYTKNGTLKFANNELLVGLDAINTFFGATFPLLSSMKHDIVTDVIGNKIYQTCTITYTVKDDPHSRSIKIPAMGVFHLVPCADFKSGEPLIERFDVFLDGSEVFGVVGEVQKLKAEGEI
ncbi:hypothetical protein BKA65DRAFT_169978 [Rhexocercosporidium sp. MPI-PUGE-AT-0058]|nr:hypothetical protein BKA65DRAFT_169978 [Rhexocercosporidium sp. MPI-PUGE-AT-0058]